MHLKHDNRLPRIDVTAIGDNIEHPLAHADLARWIQSSHGNPGLVHKVVQRTVALDRFVASVPLQRRRSEDDTVEEWNVREKVAHDRDRDHNPANAGSHDRQ